MKKKIGIFSPYLSTFGGGERYILTIAECLKRKYQVEVFWHNKKTLKKAEKKFNLKLSGVKINSKNFNTFFNKKKLFKKLILMPKYWAFFFLSDGSIPFLLAKNNFIHFQAPFIKVKGKSFLNRLKLKLVKKVICNSFFTKKFIDKEFALKSRVIYPPVDTNKLKPGKKENIILSVGRFDNFSQNKRQDFLIKVFKKMVNKGLKKWKLIIIGSISTAKGEVFYKNLQKESQKHPIQLIKEADFECLKNIYSKAKIYWHAAGYNQDLNKHPEKAEHFGITTVEAMAAGCVPVVIKAGGQPEIVQHNKNGFLWEKEKELISLTLQLIKQKNLWQKLSINAQKKSKNFSKEIFCKKINHLVF